MAALGQGKTVETAMLMSCIFECVGKLGCIIMDGAGGKAFCAGGDVAAVRAEALAGVS